jgi:leader peptidase (prepilin peptidase)/N-methyltransferase
MPETLLPAAVLAGFLVPITIADLRRRIIPNRLTASAALVAVPVVAVADPGGAGERAVAAVVAGGAFLVVVLASRGGMGMGDAKLAGVLGLYLGPAVAVAVAAALVAGTAAGVVVVIRDGVAAGRRATLPFAPFLALGAAVAILAGTPALDLAR